MKGDGGEKRGSPDDALTHGIIEAIIKVHNALGPGFLESVYHRALAIELRNQDIRFATEIDVDIEYSGHVVGRHRLDLVVDDQVIVELKTVEDLGKLHYAQVRSYLRATGLSIALLVDFSKERADYRRIVSSPHPPPSP